MSNYPEPPRYGEPLPHYGQTPQPQTPSGGVEIPAKVTLSFRLMLASAAVYLISQIWVLFQINSGALDEQLSLTLDQMEQLTGAPVIDRGALMPLMTVSSIISILIGLGLYLLVAFLIKRGFAAGRILGVIFAVFNIFSLFAFPDMIGWALGVAAVVLAWQKEASAYNRAASFARMNAKFPR